MVAKTVHSVIAQCIHNTLRQIPGGYLCRLQDGDLKYMVCFASAKVRAGGQSRS